MGVRVTLYNDDIKRILQKTLAERYNMEDAPEITMRASIDPEDYDDEPEVCIYAEWKDV